MADERSSRLPWHGLFWFALLGTLGAVLIPGEGLHWLSTHSELFSRYVAWNDAHPSGIDMGHVFLFAVLGYVAARAFVGFGYWRLLGMLAAVGAASELAQVWIPGRYARVSDFLVDVIAAAAMLWWARRAGAPWATRAGGDRE